MSHTCAEATSPNAAALLRGAVTSNREVAPAYFRLSLEAPEIAAAALPGQFVHVKCGDSLDPLLRRPLSLLTTDPSTGGIELLLRVVGRGTAWLAARKPGDKLDVLGPLGKPFSLSSRTYHLLVGGGVGIPPVLMMARALPQVGGQVLALVGARRREELLCLEDFREAGATVMVSTDDGSEGFVGFVPDLLTEVLSRCEVAAAAQEGQVAVYCCGPTAMMRQVALMISVRGLPCQVSLEARMACGIGVCLSCVVPISRRPGQHEYLRVCKDGPVFDASEVVWE